MIGDFARGLRTPFRALRLLIATPRLRKLAVLPLLVNIILFGIGVPLAVWLGVGWVDGLLPAGGFWGSTLRTVVQVLLTLAIIVGSFFLFVFVGNIVAAPFNSLLSEAIEEHLTGAPVSGGAGIVRSTARSILTAVGRLLIFLLLYPPIFLTQFIPVIGFVIHPVLAALYGAFVLSIDFSDPTFERHLDRFGAKVGFITRRKPLYLGFGLTAVAMALIPIVNFLLLPVCVTGAAILYLEEAGLVPGGTASRQ